MDKTSWYDDYDGYILKMQQKYNVPGIAVGVIKNGDPLFENGYGYRNLNEKLEVTSNTIFGIASVTKSFTCAGIMLLQEKGRLSVNDKVIKYLPEFLLPDQPEHTEKVTIHHFMTHTTGLPPLSSLAYAMKQTMDRDPSAKDYPGLDLAGKKGNPIETYEALMEHISESNVKLLGKPGEEFSYSNDCYALLGAIIERVSGITYEEFITENILVPSGMNNSTFYLGDVLSSKDVTVQYSIRASQEKEKEKEVYEAPVWWDAPAMRGAGFLRSTMKDMLLYSQIYLNNGVIGKTQILSQESVAEMMKPHVAIDGTRWYGYGLMVTPNYHGVTLVEHGGSLKAISSQLSMIPEKGIAGIMLTNLVGVPTFQMMLGALNGEMGLPVETPFISYPEYEAEKDSFTDYVGEYATEEGATITIKMEDDQLILSQDGTDIQLRQVGKNRFVLFVKESEQLVQFRSNGDGEIRAIAMGVRQIPKV
ncbi:serine hydrolase [Evansella tamaricis]|uniref:Serine hydrolase n=1 Tax=Evansella tamaricis TaxID=2069301 RepID=A0ABS6JNS5_9BACI|nr:serine hydrolase [Evansella tamaricis]MBU9714050.1 serine hydrolase [Evansella tamaricis]